MVYNPSFDFDKNVSRALNDTRLRENLRFAMGNFILKRKAIFPDQVETENLRSLCSAIKLRALSRLHELLEQFEKNCLSNGVNVHWAETTDEANRAVLDIMRSHNATRMVKGKSMVSEEMHLNSFLRDNGIEALETDLGEFIVQLAGETPSHIIVPAIHKSKEQIAGIMHEKIPDTPFTEKVEELNGIARKVIRRKFYDAQVGLSGVNFAVAETGTLCLVENEGNGRMCTTVPPVHIALMGLEKVVEKLGDLPPLLRLLTGSATGQLITTYVNMITSPRKAREKDGPEEIHLIILDNGRSKIYAEPQFRETLKCIRCGTCLNHCPVYTRIGGHAYGFVYPGPIGKILNPQVEGLKKAGVLATASSLCLACDEVCPVKIPITDIMRRLRNNLYMNGSSETLSDTCGYRYSFVDHLSWKVWRFLFCHPWFLSAGKKIRAILGLPIPNIGPLKHWTSCRTSPVLVSKSLHDMIKKEGIANE
jgi:L-lactate dehydrogenase complex protein LldF